MSYNAPPSRGSLPLGIVLGVVVGAIGVVFAWFARVDDPDRATPAQGPTPAASTPQQPQPTPSSSATPSASATPTPTPSASATPTPTPEPTAHPGVVTELPAGTWVTVLASLPKNAVTPDQAVERAAKESRDGHTAIVLDTNEFEGLNAGYWAVVIPGADSREASNQVCRDLGIPLGNKCYPREVLG